MILPKPKYTSFFHAFSKASIPPTNSVTALFFLSTALAKFALKSDISTPNFSASLTCSIKCADAYNALVGIQPRFKHVPPNLSFSINATLAPY